MSKNRNDIGLFTTEKDFEKYIESSQFRIRGKIKLSNDTHLYKFYNTKKPIYSKKYPLICYLFKTKLGWSPEFFTKRQMNDINKTQEIFWKGACEYDNNL